MTRLASSRAGFARCGGRGGHCLLVRFRGKGDEFAVDREGFELDAKSSAFLVRKAAPTLVQLRALWSRSSLVGASYSSTMKTLK